MNEAAYHPKLLLAVQKIMFEEVPGEVTYLSQDVSGLVPLVRGRAYSGTIPGIASGRRSGLLEHNGDLLKIKGCDLQEALRKKGKLRDNYNPHQTKLGGTDPLGGFLLQDAMQELCATRVYNETVSKEGFPVLQTPVAMFDYGKQYVADISNYLPLADNIAQLLGETAFDNNINRFMNQGSLVALVTKVEGDTRLHNLFEPSPAQVKFSLLQGIEFCYEMGVHVGAVKRVTQDKVLWGWNNANDGNIILVERNGNIEIGMTDFDAGRIVNQDRSYLDSLIHQNRIRRENWAIKDLFVNHVPEWNAAIMEGFNKGYVNPDSRKPIPISVLGDYLRKKI